MKDWLDIIKESHIDLLNTHPRSNEKLKAPHQWIKEKVKSLLRDGFEIVSLDKNRDLSREEKVKGRYYDKDVDICILKDNKPVGVIAFKFISSNYSQNSNNYFENMIGECFNIQKADIPFCHILVIRDKIPYYNNEKVVQKYERMTQHNIDKYIKLLKDTDKAIPVKFSLSIVSLKGDEINGDIIHPSKFKKMDESQKKKIIDSLKVEYSNNGDYNKETQELLKNMEINKILKEFVKEFIL